MDAVDDSAKLPLIEAALAKLEVSVRRERLPDESASSGGLCMIHGRLWVIVSPEAPPWEQVAVLLEALRRLDTGAIWLPPALRDLLEET